MRLFGKDVWRIAATAFAALTLTFCGGGGKGGAPTQPVVIATPTPTPVPTYQPLSATCARLPLGTDKYKCRDEQPSFMAEVNDAIDTLKAQHPEYFNAGGDRITNLGAYYVGIIKLLDKQNICAAFDGEELAVKNSADFSDQYKLQTSWNAVNRKYIGTCYPAVFPLALDNPPPSPPGCSLPPSKEIACGTAPPQFDGDIEAVLDEVMKQKPALFDFAQHPPGNPEWPLIVDMKGYIDAIVAGLVAKGYCVKYDGEEFQVKHTNDFTEHYDLNYADKYIRRGAGSYRGSCYPAAF